MTRILIFLALALGVQSQQLFDCPDKWFTFENKCYRFVLYPRANYVAALATCMDDGATLASINSVEEHRFINNWLERNDNRRDSWYTSGKVQTSGAGGIRWEGDGTFSQGFSFWLNQTFSQEDGAYIVYAHSGNEYGWSVVQVPIALSFICEIPRSEAYRILQEGRDFSYGVDTNNLNDIPRGPYFLVEPKDTTILGGTSAVFLECIAFAMPYASYIWQRNLSRGRKRVMNSEEDNRLTVTNGRMTISAPDLDDEGYYQCIAENDQGKALSRTMQLSFGTIGEFSNVAVATVRADEHEGAQVECPSIIARPAAKYQWFKNSIRTFVRPSLQSYIFISNNGKLYFSEITRIDQGIYHCIVSLTTLSGSSSNYVGASQSPSKTSLGFQVDVQSQVGGNYQPDIQDDFIAVFPPQPKKGQDIMLECFAYGTGPLIYSWSRRGGKVMPSRARYSDHNRVLTILNVAPEDQGTYRCRVYSTKTKLADEQDYALRIQSEPYFVYPLRDQHADKGSQLTWHCEADATPAARYTWYKNAQRINNITGVITVHRNTLIITNMEEERDAGVYQCEASNEHGTTYSTAQLRVLEFAPSFAKNPLDRGIAGSIGGNVTIVCNPEAAPAPEFTWLKDGRNLGLSKGGETGNMMMLMNGNLYITMLRQSDQGRYTCRVTNDLGTAEDHSYLTVVTETVLTREPANEDVVVNSTATLLCEASANANMDMIYSWMFNNHIISIDKDPHYRLGKGLTRGYLYIINAEFKHEGRYICNAATGLDVQSAEAYLTVLGPPGEPAGVYMDLRHYNLQQPRTIKLMWTDGDNHGSDVLFYDVEFSTNFNPEWRALKERIPVRDAMDQELPSKRQTILANLKAGAGYKFRVRSMNRYGLGPPSVPTTTIQIPGDKPGKAPAKVGGGCVPNEVGNICGKVGDLMITWEPLPPEDHNGDGLGYVVYWRRKPVAGESESKWEEREVPGANSDRFVHLVGAENFYTEYEVRVQAYNDFGRGNKSHIALIYSAEDLPIGTARDVYADSFNSTALIVYWIPVIDDRTNMKGKLLGYKINYWRQEDEIEIEAIQSIYEGQMDHAMIIGLQPDTWYIVNVQVYNTAGNGPKSQEYEQSTDRMAPQLYPTEVHVFSHSNTQVYVTFRGVSTQVYEEPLQGYKVQYWRLGENIRKSLNVNVEKRPEAVLDEIEKGVVYQLRVFAYSRGGQGKMSSPATYFTLGGQVVIDPSTTDIMAASSHISASIITICLMTLFSIHWLS